MAKHEASRGDEHIEATKLPANSTSHPLRRLRSNLEEKRSSKSFLPVAAELSSDQRPQRCHSHSPLANSTPVLATQRSMITMSNDSFRSQSVLDDIPTNLLRRYPRFSTATTSIETGRPDFSIEELNSTQLSDDEDDIVNDEPKQSSKGSKALLKHRVARDVKAMWRSRTSRIQHARERLQTWPHKPTHHSVDQGLHKTESIRSHVSRAALHEANDLSVQTPTLDKVTSQRELDKGSAHMACQVPSPVQSALSANAAQSEGMFATATASVSKKEEVNDGDRSELGKRVSRRVLAGG